MTEAGGVNGWEKSSLEFDVGSSTMSRRTPKAAEKRKSLSVLRYAVAVMSSMCPWRRAIFTDACMLMRAHVRKEMLGGPGLDASPTLVAVWGVLFCPWWLLRIRASLASVSAGDACSNVGGTLYSSPCAIFCLTQTISTSMFRT